MRCGWTTRFGLFRFGNGLGDTTMCIRTRDAKILTQLKGSKARICSVAVVPRADRVAPNESHARVTTSPIGRIEVYSPTSTEVGTVRLVLIRAFCRAWSPCGEPAPRVFPLRIRSSLYSH